MTDLGPWVGLLRWISAFLAFFGGVSALIWDPRKEDPATQRRRLTPTGWTRIVTTVVSLVVFVAADIEDRRLAREREQEQRRQHGAEQARLAADIKFKAEEIKSLQQIIDYQERGLRYFRHLVLVQEVLDGLALTWKPPAGVYERIRADRQIEQSLKNPADAYFRTCLLVIGMQADRTPSGRWLFRCILSRPQGVLDLRFDYGADQPQGQAFERALDHLLSKHLSIRQVGGEYLVLVNPEHRPSTVRFSPREISVSVRQPAIKLSRLEHARVEFRMDVESARLGPAAVTITSLDPTVRLGRTLVTSWAMRRYGSAWRFPGAGEEPEEVPLSAAFAGPYDLKADFSKLLFPADQPGEPASRAAPR